MENEKRDDESWQSGKPRGTIFKTPYSFQVRIRRGPGKPPIYKSFATSEHGGSEERAMAAAEDFRTKKCLELGLIKNRWRRLNRDVVQKLIDQDKTCCYDEIDFFDAIDANGDVIEMQLSQGKNVPIRRVRFETSYISHLVCSQRWQKLVRQNEKRQR